MVLSADVLEVDTEAERFDYNEESATDFDVHIGNVVLQGRYSGGVEGSRVVAEGLASAITDQVAVGRLSSFIADMRPSG